MVYRRAVSKSPGLLATVAVDKATRARRRWRRATVIACMSMSMLGVPVLWRRRRLWSARRIRVARRQRRRVGWIAIVRRLLVPVA